MSLKSFLNNSLNDPLYPFKKARWAAWQYLPERNVKSSTRHGRLNFSSKDQTIGRTLYLTGDFAASDLEKGFQFLVAKNCLKPKSNFLLLDIGANIGTTCIPFLLNGQFQRALAFEPDVKNLNYLKANIKENGLEQRVQVFECGLSSENRTAVLMQSADNFGDHRIQVQATSAPATERATCEVRLRALDEVLKSEGIDPKDVSLIWMDTQGHEAEVLKGAQSVLEAGVPCVTEFWPAGLKEAGTDTEAFCRNLARYYSQFVDLAERQPIVRPTSELSLYARKYASATSYTDLLLLRPDEQKN